MNLTFERGKLRPNSTDPVVSRVQDGKYAHWYTLKNNRPLCLLSPSIQEYHWHFAQDPTAEIKRWGPYLSLLVCSVSESWCRHHLVSRQSCSIAPKIHNLPHSCLNFPAKIMIKVWLQIMTLNCELLLILFLGFWIRGNISLRYFCKVTASLLYLAKLHFEGEVKQKWAISYQTDDKLLLKTCMKSIVYIQ